MPGSKLLSHCPLCTSRRLRYAFSQEARRAVRCADCQLLFLNPRPAEGPTRFPAGASTTQAETLLSHLESYRSQSGGRLLLVGAPGSPLHDKAEERGYSVTVTTDVAAHAHADFDLCVLDHVLDGSLEPLPFLQGCHQALRVGGTLGICTPTFDFHPPIFAPQDLQRFDARTLQTALFFSGFAEAIVEPAQHSSAAGLVLCQAAPVRAQRLLSIVVPAYNEAASLAELMEALLAKVVPGLQTEIVLVESNSTDGTREIAMGYSERPGVKVILEDRPRGKGHAVRTGLSRAKGDFILIQDADLEYDLEDYDALLGPLVAGHEAFVLGSRHSGSVWKMRQFSGQASLSAVLNLGHWIFTTLVNVLFHQRLKDPFTMYKVFRRDCLFGLRFECDRFDFDYELLIKLIRKGYQPIELPVNYRSRSFKQGKKVSMVRDPLTWLRALVRLRLAKIDPLAEIVRARHESQASSPVSAPVAACFSQL